MTHIKIKESSLLRDMDNMAIINTDNNELQAYLNQREHFLKRTEEINEMKSEIQDIKSNINELKTLLLQILNNKT